MTDEEHVRAVKEALSSFINVCNKAHRAGLTIELCPEYAGRFTKDNWTPHTLESAGLSIKRVF